MAPRGPHGGHRRPVPLPPLLIAASQETQPPLSRWSQSWTSDSRSAVAGAHDPAASIPVAFFPLVSNVFIHHFDRSCINQVAPAAHPWISPRPTRRSTLPTLPTLGPPPPHPRPTPGTPGPHQGTVSGPMMAMRGTGLVPPLFPEGMWLEGACTDTKMAAGPALGGKGTHPPYPIPARWPARTSFRAAASAVFFLFLPLLLGLLIGGGGGGWGAVAACARSRLAVPPVSVPDRALCRAAQ